MGFRAVVTSTHLVSTPAELRVLKVLLGDKEVVDAPAAEIGARANTHESTVIRLARKLGYRGYPELRADLRADGAGLVTTGGMRAESDWPLSSLAANQVNDLQRVSQVLPQSDIDAAAVSIVAASRIYLLATPDLLPVAQLMDHGLRRLGIPVIRITPNTQELAANLASLDANSVLVAFASHEAPSYLPRVITETRRRGAKTTLLTDFPGYTFRPQPDHLLTAPSNSGTNYNTLLIPMTICYALQLAVFHRDSVRFQGSRDDIDVLRSSLSAPTMPGSVM